MAQNVIINGVTYSNVPEVDIPKQGGGTAKFYDTAGADAAAGDVLTGKDFYTSTGPAIYDFYVEDDEVHVVTSPCERIYVGGKHRAHQRKLGRHITEFVTKLKGREHMVRCEAMDASGRSAYSNPIFLD